MQENEQQEEKKYALTLDGKVVGIATATVAGSAMILAETQPAEALDVAEVNTTMNLIITNTDAAADIAFPIGAALLAFATIGGIIMRFIM